MHQQTERDRLEDSGSQRHVHIPIILLQKESSADENRIRKDKDQTEVFKLSEEEFTFRLHLTISLVPVVHENEACG